MKGDRYIIDRRFSSSVERSQRVLECAEAFGLGLEEKEFVVYDNLHLEVRQGDVVYISGQSGSGKSLLLRDLAEQMDRRGHKVQNIDTVLFEEKPLIDQVGKNTDDAIRILSLAGLNDAYLFIRKPSELSDGQRYRFSLAKLMESDARVWVADEFGAVLDRTTAKAVAFSMQKFARKVGATLIVATTHKDLRKELAPDIFVDKEYKAKIKVEVANDIAGQREGAEDQKEGEGQKARPHNQSTNLRNQHGVVLRPGSSDKGDGKTRDTGSVRKRTHPAGHK